MKARVLKRFRDLKTGVVHERGEFIEVGKARYNELRGTRYGDLVEAMEPEKAETAADEAVETEEVSEERVEKPVGEQKAETAAKRPTKKS